MERVGFLLERRCRKYLLCVSRPSQGVWPLLPLPEGLYRPVDGLLVSAAGGDGRQLTCLLHHSLHRGSFRLADLHHLHL